MYIESTTTEGIKTLQVVSTPPLKLAEDEHTIEWSRRSTDKNPVATSERYRGVVIKRSALAVPADACSSKFSRLLQQTVNSLADAHFTTWVKDRMSETQIPAALLTLDSVLAYWAEEKQRTSIDGSAITAFLQQCKTFATLNAEQRKGWLNKLPKIAAPAYKQLFTQEQAATIVSRIVDEDTEHPAAVFIIQRCNNILNATSEEEAL